MNVSESAPSPRGQTPDRGFTLRDYLEAARLASNRARTVTIILLVVSVIMLIGVLNSLYHCWAQRRILACSSPQSEYVAGNIGPPPVLHCGESDESFSHERVLYEQRYHELYAGLMKQYVENGFGVQVPLFGVTIDANDFGAFGGFALLIVLFMFDYCARQESQNLTVSFNRAMEGRELMEFYDLLAMHQLLTVPLRAEGERRERSAVFPKVICLLPFIVQAVVVSHDFYTNPTGNALDPTHNAILNVIAVIWLLLMIPASIWTIRRLYGIDRTWDTWAKIRFRSVTP